MANFNYVNRMIQFSSEELESREQAFTALLFTLGFMLYPKHGDIQKAQNFQNGAFLEHIKDRPELLASLPPDDLVELPEILAKASDASKIFAQAIEKKPRAQFSLLQKGKIAGRMGRALLTHLENIATVYRAVQTNPGLIGEKKAPSISALQKIWQEDSCGFIHTVNFWSAYVLISDDLKQDLLEIVETGSDEDAVEVVKVFLMRASTLYYAFTEKSDPTVGDCQLQAGHDHKISPKNLIQPMLNGEPFPRSRFKIEYGTTWKAALERKNPPLYMIGQHIVPNWSLGLNTVFSYDKKRWPHGPIFTKFFS